MWLTLKIIFGVFASFAFVSKEIIKDTSSVWQDDQSVFIWTFSQLAVMCCEGLGQALSFTSH